MYAPQQYATKFNTACDANGNMIGNEQNGLTSARYDWRNLPSIMMTGSETMHYGYDGEGQRVRKRTGGGSDVHYIRGADGQVLAVYKNDAFTYHNIIAGGEMIGNHDGTERRYYLKDHLGSIRMTVSETGTGYDDYYPFGLTMPGRSSNSANPNDNYKYTGHELDDEAGLDIYHMNARAMDPVLGRFMQIDPLADQFPGISPYAYGNNNPLRYTDPTGMAPIDDYKLDRLTGEITLIRETDDDFDVLYATDNQGNVDESTSLKVNDQSILPQLSQERSDFTTTPFAGQTFPGRFANTNSRSDALGVFGFASRNSNVEWSFQGYTDGSFSLATANKDWITATGNNHSSNANKIVAWDIHSHPSNTRSDLRASDNDWRRADYFIRKNPNAKVWLYMPKARSSLRIIDLTFREYIKYINE